MAEAGFEGFIDTGLDFDDVQEQELVKTGSYDLTVESAKGIKTLQEDGNLAMTKIQVILSVDGMPNAASIFHNISLPKAGDAPKSARFKVLLMKRFCKLFNVHLGQSGINTTDLVGARASDCEVELTSYEKQLNDGTTKTIPTNRLVLDNVRV